MLNDILGVAIGIFLVYLLLSLILSTFIDWLARVVGWRAWVLERWLRNLLKDEAGKGMVERIYDHPLISALFTETGGKPACIPARSFALALLDVFAPSKEVDEPRDLKEIRKVIKDSGTDAPAIRQALLVLIDEAQGKFERAIENIQAWFDDPGGTATARYRWHIQIAVFIVAFVICSILNLDTIMIAGELWRQPALREAAVAVAEDLASDPTSAESDSAGTRMQMQAKDFLGKLGEARIPVGWCQTCEEKDPRRFPKTGQGWLLKVLGILATTLSASLGAPFWFDLLRKIIGIRESLKRPGGGQKVTPAGAGGAGP
jgi:hypothetical protein